VSTFELSNEQEQCIKDIKHWRRNKTKPWYLLTGPAGSGKSELIKKTLETVKGEVILAGPTGMSALIMSQRTGRPAQTIHSLIYKPAGTGGNREAIERMKKELEIVTESSDRGKVLVRELKNLLSAVKPLFNLNLESPLREAALLVVDECFVKGTLVDTPSGLVSIETLKPGDKVINAIGTDSVIATSKKISQNVCQIKAGTTKITCSENHVFFTSRGEVFARDLRPDDRLVSTRESMRLLSDYVSTEGEDRTCSILQHQLWLAMASEEAGLSRSLHGRKKYESGTGEKDILSFWNTRGSGSGRSNKKTKSDRRSECLQENKRNTQEEWSQTLSTGRKWEGTYSPTEKTLVGSRARMDTRIYPNHREWLPAPSLQIGHRRSNQNDLPRNRWRQPPFQSSQGARSQKRHISGFTRVDSVEILEQGDTRLDRFRDADGKLYLYDIQCLRHHSFSVQGHLVHNCSMVPEYVIQDLLSFNVPVLFQGDFDQLPPVASKTSFKASDADFKLTQVHRQAKDSPIIYLATLAREGRPLPIGRYGDSVVTREVSVDSAMSHDRIIVGKNSTRHATNAKIRNILGRVSELPEPGDKIMCLHNNAKAGLMNGQKFIVTSFDDIDKYICSLGVKGDDIDSRFVAHKDYFFEKEPDPWHKQRAENFGYAYAVTCHKMQGDQAPAVYVMDQSRYFRGQEKAWLYTACTRSQTRLTVKLT
jgi:exodeoxyribonuclease-5